MTTFSDRVSQWHEILPQCKERLKSVAIDERSLPFAINIYEAVGLREQYFKDISGETNGPSSIHLRISLFDHEFGLFFGKTWKTQNKNYKGQNSINFNKTAFFHSSINREQILFVLELVATWKNDDEHDFEVSCGWGACLAFKSDICNTEFGSSKKSANILKIDLYPGTPRSLFYIEDFKEFQKDHPSNKFSVSISTQLHSLMSPCINLMPENLLFSEVEDVPGILASTGLKRPQLCQRLRSSLEKIEIRLIPNLNEFEETFKRLICEDVLKDLHGSFTHEDIVISRRTLRVGVHNGKTFVGPLEDIQISLNSDVLIKRVSRKLSTKSSLQKKNVASVAATILQGSRMNKGDEVDYLVHNTRVEIEGMLKDVNFHFIFALIYEITLPRPDGNDDAAKNRLASIAQPVMEILVRWGVLGYQDGMEPGHQEVILSGSPRINPFGNMVYTSNPPIFDENLSGNAIKNAIRSNSEVLSFALQLSEGEDLPLFLTNPPTYNVVQTSPQLKKDSTIQEKYKRIVLISPEKQDDKEEHLKEFPSKQGDTKSSEDSHEHEMIAEPWTASKSTELKELPYFPVQVPILPAFPAAKRDLTGNGLSRAAFAQLLTLNFPVVLAANGNPAEVIDPSNLIGQMLLEKEYDDQLKVNEITFQFMAFNRLPTSGGFDSIVAPSTIFFTFQFFRFDLITSERLMLEVVDKEVTQNNFNELLYVLRKIEGDGTVAGGPPGYQVKFIVDAATVGQVEGRGFFKYLNEQLLHIDVWDADSLFHIGECLLDLKVLMRQGKSAVQSTVELDIWKTEYIEPEMVVTDAVVVKEAVAKPIEVMTSLRGKLLMRTGNVGKKISLSVADGFLKRRNENSISYLANMIRKSRANRLPEVSYELLQMIVGQKQPLAGSSIMMDKDVERMKKMRRMEALKKKLINEDQADESFPIASLRSETESRQRDLHTVEMYRQNIKPDNIKNILCRHITTDIIIKTSLGTTSFFEFPLQNPHNVEVVVLIEWVDPDLSVISNAGEWRHFKAINNVTTPLEEGMFTATPIQESDAHIEDSRVVELFLRPKESVHIPFKFLTFRHPIQVQPVCSDFVTRSMLSLDKLAKDDVIADGGDDDDAEKNVTNGDVLEQASNNRSIKINFRIKRDMSMLAILDLTINQQPHIINQTFRLTQPEQTFLKKSFRMPQWPQLTGSQNQSGGNQVFVRCSDPNVICTSSKAAPGNPIDVLIKVACGSAPQVKDFFIVIYTDSRLSKPLQIWQIHVRIMQRVDIAAVQGQTVRFTLMMRGSLASLLVGCYSSHPRQMSLNPEEPFMLLAGNLQQINVGIRPMKVGVSSMFVNVVDIESHQLVTSWLIHVITQEPIISRQFEISLTIGGPGENKRISFINPYGYQKIFYIHTSHEHLLLFKDNKLELGPTQKGHIGMKFLTSNKPGRVTMLVFINDEEDKNEETFAVRVNFRR